MQQHGLIFLPNDDFLFVITALQIVHYSILDVPVHYNHFINDVYMNNNLSFLINI